MIWAIVYQQFENNLIQPQVQKRTVRCTRSSCSSRCCSAPRCWACSGALVAIPIAASIQIAAPDWWQWRKETSGDTQMELGAGGSGEASPGGSAA